MSKNLTAKTFAVATAAAMALSSFALPLAASAAINSSSFTIKTTNRGTIDNTTKARAYTGDNDNTGGSEGGDAGDAGDVLGGTGSNNNGGATAGSSGNGGNAGDGALVDTGDASADAGTTNRLNDTFVEIDLTSAAEDVNSTFLDVTTDNQDINNKILNLTHARARTGDNDNTEGSEGGDSGIGGNIDGGTGGFNNGGAGAGSAGSGGTSSFGGEVRTGKADSKAGTVNVLNLSITRVRI